MSCVWSMAKSRWFAQIDLRSWFTVNDSTWKSRFLNFLLSRRPTSLPRCSLFTMPSPQKKKRGKSNGTRAKRSKTASTPTRPRKKKSNKRGPYRQFSKAEKDIRDALIENAAKAIIKARANNQKNKPKWDRSIRQRMQSLQHSQPWLRMMWLRLHPIQHVPRAIWTLCLTLISWWRFWLVIVTIMQTLQARSRFHQAIRILPQTAASTSSSSIQFRRRRQWRRRWSCIRRRKGGEEYSEGEEGDEDDAWAWRG